MLVRNEKARSGKRRFMAAAYALRRVVRVWALSARDPRAFPRRAHENVADLEAGKLSGERSREAAYRNHVRGSRGL